MFVKTVLEIQFFDHLEAVVYDSVELYCTYHEAFMILAYPHWYKWGAQKY